MALQWLDLGNKMHPSDRIKYIKGIAEELAKEEWEFIDLTLKQFGLPWTDQWNGNKETYVIQMLGDAAAKPLLELAKHFGVASQLASTVNPGFWGEQDARLFLSHLAKMKKETKSLKDELAKYSISAFVAHEDIEPTKEWQSEIESALSTMDGLVALLSPGFKESNWCDQEVGVAIGRKLPIISVRLGLDPYGFIGKYQALQGVEKTPAQIAQNLFDLLLINPTIGPKITGALVGKLILAETYAESKRLIALIEQSKFLNSKHISAMKEAAKNNSQVYDSWGVPEKINKIAKEIEN
ncbi:toll/interleukin-1 receptor domain-containing protein [Desulfuromonas acetexigens]|nr:toll/interleukin-1 receptor domain-containing protein [Desulfuromonas acetexigens]